MLKLAALLAAVPLLAQAPAEEVVAVTGAKIITVAKGEIASGTIVIRGGKIAEIGEAVKPPAGAKVIDGRGLVAFPGLVHPYSRIAAPQRAQPTGDGPRGPRPPGEGGGAGGGSNPQVLAYDELSAAAEILRSIPRTGYTTLAIYPAGGTVSGQAVVIKPTGFSRDEMVVAKSAYLRIAMEANTQAKETLRRDLEAAKRALDGQRRPPSSPPAAPPAAAPPPGQAPPAKPDEKTEVWIRVLKGELPAVVAVSTPAELLHFRQVARPYDELKLAVTYVLPLEAWKAADRIAELKPRVIMEPELAAVPYTRTRVNAVADVARAGATVAVVPPFEILPAYEAVLSKLAELVKHGLDRETALRAVTIVPAEILGLEKRVGSLEAGKDADIVLFDGDPLSATARVMRVLINGKAVYAP